MRGMMRKQTAATRAAAAAASSPSSPAAATASARQHGVGETQPTRGADPPPVQVSAVPLLSPLPSAVPKMVLRKVHICGRYFGVFYTDSDSSSNHQTPPFESRYRSN